ncbi:MAG: hypothetical protein Q9197_001676 [Variospora fuerteventurae]
MPATEFWFASDEEFFTAIEDYALVGRTVTWVREELQEKEDILDDEFGYDSACYDHEGRLRERKLTFEDLILGWVPFGQNFSMLRDRQLLYGDVDYKDPAHKDVNIRIAKEGLFEEESEKSKEARKKLISHVTSISGETHGKHLDVDEDLVYRTVTRENREAEIFMNRDGISPTIVDYIIGLEEEGDRETILSVLSNQHLRKTQRPLLLLVDMVTPGPVTATGRTGWAIAYNFHEKRVIIKPCVFDKGHHPLAEKWDIELPNDGICFSGHPSALVDKLLQLHADIKGKEDEKDPLKYGFHMLVYHAVGSWLVRHWKSLAGMAEKHGNGALTDEKLRQSKEALTAIIEAAGCIEFPEVKEDPKPRRPSERFLFLQNDLEDCEEGYREEALGAKASGKEDLAKRMAELYSSVLGQLYAFNNMTLDD